MRALQYFFGEAAESLWRNRRAASLSMLTIAAGLFVLGFFLVVNANLQRLMARWSEAAELSVFVKDDVLPAQIAAIERQVDQSGLAIGRTFVSKPDAAARFRQDFPDLGRTADQIGGNPFPASIDVRLNPAASGESVDALATTLSSAPGVADLRYDRRLLTRLRGLVRTVRTVALVIVSLLALAAALTVASVVRLAVQARREEIEIMQLVGAPLGFVRGPFIAEGVLQGGGGALIAVSALWIAFVVLRTRVAPLIETLGVGPVTFLPVSTWLALVAGGMLLGCVGGLIVARGVR